LTYKCCRNEFEFKTFNTSIILYNQIYYYFTLNFDMHLLPSINNNLLLEGAFEG